MSSKNSDILQRTFAVIDTETTGTSPVYGRVIEVAILRVENGQIVRTYRSLVNPGRAISATIQSITGITNEELQDAPSFQDIAYEVREMLEDAVFVAHNARFDYAFLKEEFRRLDMPFRASLLCTVKLSRKLFPRWSRHDLSSIIHRFNIPCVSRHRAFDDADALFRYLEILRHEHGDEHFAQALQETMTGNLPAQLERTAIDSLPDAPGVYLMYGGEGELLYVGKSVSVRRRVLSHFSSTVGREVQICGQVHRIETRQTAGELGALLLESQLIKQLRPIYNRAARQKRNLVVLRRGESPEGYATVEMESPDSIDPASIGSILTIFKHRKQAKDYLAEIAKEHQLCHKLLGLEETSGNCFQYHLHRCKGACTGLEDAAEYNRRFAESFRARQIRAWPYSGGIVIEERGDQEGEGQAFLVDQWCLVSTIHYTAEGEQEVIPGNVYFDYDSYKILSRYIRHNGKNVRRVKREEFDKMVESLRSAEEIS